MIQQSGPATSLLRFPEHPGDLIGAHLSTQGGVHSAFSRARTVGADAIALFSKSSNQWKARPFDDATLTLFNSERAQFPSTPLMTHASYLINLAGTDPVLYEKSIDAMVDELERADMLGAYAVVLHPGAHVGTGVTSATSRFCALL